MYLLLAKTHRNSLDNPPIFYVSEWTNAFAVGLHRWVHSQIRRNDKLRKRQAIEATGPPTIGGQCCWNSRLPVTRFDKL
jgi:hypothetical protein